jgi:hypothetical protein
MKSKLKKTNKIFFLKNTLLIYFNFIVFVFSFSIILIGNYFFLFFLQLLKIEDLKQKKYPKKEKTFSFFYSFSSLGLACLLVFQIFQIKNSLKQEFIAQQEIKNKEFNLKPDFLIPLPNQNKIIKIKLKNAKSELNKINIFLKKQPIDLQLLKNKIIISQHLNNYHTASQTKKILDQQNHI